MVTCYIYILIIYYVYHPKYLYVYLLYYVYIYIISIFMDFHYPVWFFQGVRVDTLDIPPKNDYKWRL